jgi:putative transposase
VTICSQYREYLFGEITNDEMPQNAFGKVMQKWWNELPNYYAPAMLDEFVVMPNHIHGIIVISDVVGAGSSRPATPMKRTLGQLIGHYKFQCTKEINTLRDAGSIKVLQRDYYEHIIRDEHEWSAIAKYIRNNPLNWSQDADNLANIANRPLPNNADVYWHDAGL